MPANFDDELRVAIEAVRTAARVCRSVQEKITPDVMEKDDRSPVTVADFASQAVICRAIGAAFPGDPIIGDPMLILFNADHAVEISFTMPLVETGQFWKRLFDTALEDQDDGEDGTPIEGSAYKLAPCSMAAFYSPVPPEGIPPVLEAGEIPASIAEEVPPKTAK